MKSKASIKSHPLHPILVSFPIVFLTSAFFVSLSSLFHNMDAWWSIGPSLIIAGIISAVIAAVPGLIDYCLVIPPDSSAKKRGTYHMIVNLCAVGLFAISYWNWSREDLTSPPENLTLLLEGAGMLVMFGGGWLGGTLVYRNQIGVDHRYAESGKWKEASFQEGKTVTVAKSDELQAGQMKLLHIGDKRIVLGKTDDGYTAFDDRCTHKGASLADGALVCGKVQCPWHGSQFDVKTGAVHAGPAKEPVKIYRTEEQNGSVLLHI